MKTISQPVNEVLRLEKDDTRNYFKKQMKVWKVHNGTTVIVRAYVPGQVRADNYGLPNVRNWGEVSDFLLGFLQTMKVIGNKENWESSSHIINSFVAQDEAREDDPDFMYWVWTMKSHLIDQF